ncbi:hypothetical protein [Streptosporangium oxazolinicum]|uniref:hypothetical protein n=1 Tax=Streptosporangium oxazolinicum TaxID=909287 RepID=UPI0031EAF9C3
MGRPSKHTEEFRRDAVEPVQSSGRPVNEVAREPDRAWEPSNQRGAPDDTALWRLLLESEICRRTFDAFPAPASLSAKCQGRLDVAGAGGTQAVLERLGAYRDPFTGRFLVPSERTFRRVLADLDADALDSAISDYVTGVVAQVAPVPSIPDTPGPIEREQRHDTPSLPRAGCCPAPLWMAKPAAGPGPPRAGGSSCSR